ncbi:MAG: hypothetical protein K6C34_03260 [Alphaproteobacteria bacterium]|nr:hypothetical protein [Alphaproteobacteria bacterium]
MEKDIRGPVRVIVSYPLTKPLTALAILGNSYMIFGCKEIRVVSEEVLGQDPSGNIYNRGRMNVLPSLWNPITKRQLFEVDEFLKFCKDERTSLGH